MNNKSSHNGCIWALLILLLCPWLVVAIPAGFGLLMGMFGAGLGLLGAGIGLLAAIPVFLSTLLSDGWISLLVISLLLAVLLPLGFVIYLMVELIRGHGLGTLRTWLIVLLVWLLSLVGIAASAGKAIHDAGGIERVMQELQNGSQSYEYYWSNEDSSNAGC